MFNEINKLIAPWQVDPSKYYRSMNVIDWFLLESFEVQIFISWYYLVYTSFSNSYPINSPPGLLIIFILSTCASSDHSSSLIKIKLWRQISCFSLNFHDRFFFNFQTYTCLPWLNISSIYTIAVNCKQHLCSAISNVNQQIATKIYQQIYNWLKTYRHLSIYWIF